MKSLSHEELKSLLDRKNGFCVSLFMPTFRMGAESQQNQIRFKNLIRQTEDALLAHSLRPQEVKILMEPAVALTNNVLFWRRQSDGLAIFLSGNFFRFYCLPLLFNELIFVSDRFHVKPLLQLFRGEERFYIVALSQNFVKFLEGSRYSVREIDVSALPKNLADVLSYEEPEKQVRFRTGTPGGGDRGTMISGHGPDIEDTKDNLLKYFRQIDKALRSFLKDERIPMVLAGVDYLFPIYKDSNTYPYLMAEGIAGNPEGMSAEQLHRQAWQIVLPHFQKAENDALAQYRQSSGTGLTSSSIGEIVAAAYHGRVGILFIALGQQQWGIFSPDSGEVLLHQQMETGSEDLLDLASVHTYLNGGTVFVIPQEHMPVNEFIAAVFRY